MSEKPLPPGWRISHTLVQMRPDAHVPLDLVPDVFEVGDEVPRLTPEDLDQVSLLMCNELGLFKQRPGTSSTCLMLDRVAPGKCALCQRTHEKDGLWIYPNKGQTCAVVGCCRDALNRKRTIVLSCNGPDKQSGPGAFDSRSPLLFSSAEELEILVDTEKSYCEGSPMGAGKTERFMAQLKEKDTAIVVSYRKAYSQDICQKYNFKDYSKISGRISLKEHKRVVVQCESLCRIDFDCELRHLFVDELAGIAGTYSARRTKKTTEKCALSRASCCCGPCVKPNGWSSQTRC